MIHIVVPSIPPSANNAYSNIRGTNKRVLSTEGKAYKRVTSAHIAQKYFGQLKFFRSDAAYLMVVRFWMNVYTKTWPKEAKNRFLKLDTGNRLKLLEDAFKDATGIDDSQSLTLILQKVEPTDGVEKTEIWVWDLDQEETPFDSALAAL